MERMLDRNLITQALGITDAEELSDDYIIAKIRQLSNVTRPASTSSEEAENPNNDNSTTRDAHQCNSSLKKILDVIKTELPRFSGNVKVESAFEFLEAYSEFQLNNGLTEEQLLVPRTLKSSARFWFLLPSPYSSYSCFRVAFLRQFFSFPYED